MIGVLLAAVAGAAALYLPRSGATPAEPPGGPAVARVAPRTLEAVVKATGVIKPRVGAEVRVGSRLSGVVNRLYVKVGDTVVHGQPLAELDNRELVARRDSVAAGLVRSLAEARYARADLRRKRELATANVISPGDLELAVRACVVAQQQVAAAQAEVAIADTQLGYARITAPIDGVVASVATQEGETVTASFAAPTFVTLIDLSRLEVWAYVDETDIGRIHPAQAARFTVDTYGDQEFEGLVTAIYPKAEIRDNVVNYITVVKFDPPAGRVLRPEMTTTVRIASSRRAAGLSLPARAVRTADGRAFVLVAGPDGHRTRRWITTGMQAGDFLEIVDGLREGDEVLVGNVNLKEGEP